MEVFIMSNKEFIIMQIKLFHELFWVVRFHSRVGCWRVGQLVSQSQGKVFQTERGLENVGPT